MRGDDDRREPDQIAGVPLPEEQTVLIGHDGAHDGIIARMQAGRLPNAALLHGPVAVILSIPLTILTFGLFLLVVNAGMLALVAALVPSFTVAGFWSALFGAIVVSIVSGLINGALAEGSLRG